MIRNIKMVYQYDGSSFYGFQRQPSHRTVQGLIEEIMKNAFDEDINLISSGRTDRNVHAKGQVSNFILKKDIDLKVIKNKIEKYAKNEIKILDISEVDINYNSRYDSKIRTYEYIVKNNKDITPFERKYVTGINFDIDIDKLNKILLNFVGVHNFSSFSKKENKVEKNPQREIFEAYSVKKENRVHIYIKGSSFLKTMVRIMVATAFAIYEGKLDEKYINEKFKNPDEDCKKLVISPNGLYLYEVI